MKYEVMRARTQVRLLETLTGKKTKHVAASPYGFPRPLPADIYQTAIPTTPPKKVAIMRKMKLIAVSPLNRAKVSWAMMLHHRIKKSEDVYLYSRTRVGAYIAQTHLCSLNRLVSFRMKTTNPTLDYTHHKPKQPMSP